jgi:hypothetical protein
MSRRKIRLGTLRRSRVATALISFRASVIVSPGIICNFTVEQALQTMPGAKTMVLDTKTGHVLTMTAEYGPPPANAPPERAGTARGPMVPGPFSILMVSK